ncbi:MAG: ABC transporter substrate-binding protein, partial [Actinobacteria bacterium]|nr:ABC transporter substrate-binding protein [Actinomycetota bacterium]
MHAGPRARRAGAATAAALALVLLAGCTSSDSTSPDATTSTTATPTSGGDLVIGVTSDPDTLDPWKATQFQAVNVLQNLYGTLTEFDQDLAVVPGLATSWDVSDDGLTVTFHLREGVTFADGSTFDSADVVYSLTKIKDEATAAVARASLGSMASVAAPDASTVVLTLSAADAALPANLAVINMAMVSSDDDEATLASTPDGTGPFVLDSRTPNESITLKRNDAYWGDKAYLDTVEFRVIPDETSIVSAMQSGNVQLAVFDDPLVAQT